MDELSYLTRQINALGKAIAHARKLSPGMVPHLTSLRDQMSNRLKGLHNQKESKETDDVLKAFAGAFVILLAVLTFMGFLLHR